ncbi:MAG: excinuclease ABC subunit UvrA [Candidatus Dadabacteria bacterium]|nr:excinuclease ABC subunit UvrA [Candidatus Dadabacteria bacterium]NIS08004.1 excinuclease ABC subunit UvrA [Candidatus Dadabacteria bacterium]NIY21583.1 excinuclease ABC subunit UvrA [Candidatus Dadabacteria bacterium]
MEKFIQVKGARLHNLKNIDVNIPLHKFTVVTGLSGSGKSSLALDTIYAEGLRRYIESLSTYARQFLDRVEKPDIDEIKGIPPSIAVESRNSIKNSRSTVGTITEIYDYLRLLYAKIGRLICPNCDIEVKKHSPQSISEFVIKQFPDQLLIITINTSKDDISNPEIPLSKGFTKIFRDSEEVYEIEELDGLLKNDEIIVDRLRISEETRSRLIDSVESGFMQSHQILFHIDKKPLLKFTKELQCPKCSEHFSEPTPQMFSFNSPSGACRKCSGFGNILDLDPELVVPDPDKSLYEGAIEPFTKPSLDHARTRLLHFAKKSGINTNVPYKDLSDEEKEMIFGGGEGYRGVRGYFKRLEDKNYKLHVRVFLSKYRSAYPCTECSGTRIVPEALLFKINGRDIAQVSNMPVNELSEFFKSLRLSDYETEVANEILKQINSRVGFLLKVGLDYLTLSRLAKTLSGGESQRVNLSCQLGSSLTETLYILDEPSIGLHQRDIRQLIAIIKELTQRNNTVILVEHDLDMIRASNYIVELGPKSGEQGGRLVFSGSKSKFDGNSFESITKSYYLGEKQIEIPKKRRKGNGNSITIEGAKENNLKNIKVSFPLGTFICVTGVSGSGKSSLLNDILYSALARKFNSDIERVGNYKSIKGTEHISNIYLLDQKPIGKSSRSNPATYLKIYDDIRKLFADTWTAKSKGLKASHFSFNVQGGRCDKCEGEGQETVEMLFLADVYITCEQCRGKRFKDEVLAIQYSKKNIDEVLQLTIDDALSFFRETPRIVQKLKVLSDVGLGYLRLGQSSATLSGGEAQRIKIAKELSGKNGKDILYILDEPTVGLHIDDVSRLLRVLNKLVDSGNTVILIEHNLDVIKSADYIIDLGPEGGDKGGRVVAKGTPEQAAKVKESYTGSFLKEIFKNKN